MTLKEELQKKNSIPFPEGKIVTLDGRELDGFPLATHRAAIDNELSLDTTGQYLSLKSGRCSRKSIDVPEKTDDQKKLFTDNAFYLLAHKDRIMNDSRMFLCQVDVHSGLAYTGTSGFQAPTIGVYLEWWSNCDNAMQKDDSGEVRLVYYLAGSPLSGRNSCAVVYQDGRTESVHLTSFISYWPPFIEINRRYDTAKQRYHAYSLQQVLDILHREDDGDVDFAHMIETEMMKKEVKRLNRQLECAEREGELWHKKYNHLLLQTKDKEVRQLYNAYIEMEKQSTAEIEQLTEKRRQYRSEMKKGNITHLQYQPLIRPLNKRKEYLVMEMYRFRVQKVRELFPDDRITFDHVAEYVQSSQLTASNK
jgi:hypothetical protein